MRRDLTAVEYRALAEVRFLIRRFLNNSERAARSVGLEPQQYLGLLMLRGLPPDVAPTIRALADRLQIRHHSAVELVDRMERKGLFRRERSAHDRRVVLLRVTPRGERLLRRLVPHRIEELRQVAPAFVRALAGAISGAQKTRPRRRPIAIRPKKGVPAR